MVTSRPLVGLARGDRVAGWHSRGYPVSTRGPGVL